MYYFALQTCQVHTDNQFLTGDTDSVIMEKEFIDLEN